jgi:flagellar assembly factor FliW
VHASKLGESMQRQVEREEVDLAPLKLAGPGDAEWFVVLNRVEGRATCNLRGPIVINTVRMIGRQVVLADPRFDVRHSLVAVEEPALALA